RGRFAIGALFDVAIDQGVFAGSRRAQGKDVIALTVHGDAQFNGSNGALLADKLDADIQISGGREFDAVQSTARVKCFRRQRVNRGHNPVLSMGAHEWSSFTLYYTPSW